MNLAFFPTSVKPLGGFPLFPGTVYKPGLVNANSRWKVWPLANCFCYTVLFEVDKAAMSLKPQGRLGKGGAPTA